jgi:hypothetical protein
MLFLGLYSLPSLDFRLDFFSEAVELSRRAIPLIFLIITYVAVIVPFTHYLKNRPIAIKLGYVPEAKIVKPIVGDQRYLAAELYVLKVLFYYGSLVEKFRNEIAIPPENYNMFKTLEAAVVLDPYNMDAYYFSQAAFTWEVGHAKDVNAMLKYGMKYRSWDYWLPFYAGFNAAYFLHDYKTAALYMKRAAQLSGNSLLTTLAARYFYEAGENELGILFLNTMTKDAKDERIRKVYKLREQALLAVQFLDDAIARFKKKHGRGPKDLKELVVSGIITRLPEDPYGGHFFLDPVGKIRSTSKFASRSTSEKE